MRPTAPLFCAATLQMGTAMAAPGVPGTPAPVPEIEEALPPYSAEVQHDEGHWRVTYRFSQPQSALLFDTSHGSYRTEAWKPSVGVTLENHGGLDGMFFDEPASEATFVITPPETPTDGTPALLHFSDGSTAFYTGQLALLTIESREAAIALNGNLRAWKGDQPPVEVHISGNGQQVFSPTGSHSSAHTTARYGRGPYVYIGPVAAVDDRLVDPGLPEWVKQSFPGELERVATALSKAWTQDVPHQALLAWGGAGDFNNRGRAEGKQISMRIRGDRYATPNDPVMDDLIWFFAHEITHLHQFQDRGDSSAFAVEGFADTLATRTLLELGRYETREVEAKYARVAWECGQKLERPLAGTRGRAAYVCGDLVGLAISSALPDHDLVGVWKQAREKAGGGFGHDGLFEAVTARGAQPDAVEAIRSFVTEQHTDTDQAILALFEAVGLKAKVKKGTLQRVSLPY